MIYSIDETHDPKLISWVESANDPATDFPIQNLPYGLFTLDEDELPTIGVAIGDQVLNLAELAETLWAQDYGDFLADACTYENFDLLTALEPSEHIELRRRLSQLLRADNNSGERDVAAGCLVPLDEVQLMLPLEIGDYTDFYASLHHATNVGKLFRPDQPLLPNYKWVPIGYHGRASSIVPSGTVVFRPWGQTLADGAAQPEFGPTKALDYELELGCFIGNPNSLGEPITMAEAEQCIFGFCLVNDWSARDVQRWEYQPLGPFLSKSFATSVSPWVVTPMALAPFRTAAFARAADDPQPLDYLDAPENRTHGGLDIQLEAALLTAKMRAAKKAPQQLTRSNAKELYWTFAQMIAHHTSNGCNLRSGDLLASGTVSGPTSEARGCLLELTERGAQPIQLPNGEERRFLQDGDEVILRGWCDRPGFRRIGFGECRGIVASAGC